MIPWAECKKGMIYRVRSRNLLVAVFDGQTGFIGIREKFGARYLFTELHWEVSECFGTVKPLQEITMVASGVDLVDGYHPGEGENPPESGVYLPNDVLFHILEPLDEEENRKRFPTEGGE